MFRLSTLLCCSVLTIFFCPCKSASCQIATFSGFSGELRAAGKSVPFPKSVLHSFGLMQNPDVISELGLTDSQRRDVEELLLETKGTPAVVRLPIDAFDGLSETEANLMVEAIRLNRHERVESLLTDEQKKRLSNIVYQYEIARVGYKEALLNGFLGQDAKIDDSQRAALNAAFERIETDVLSQSWGIESDTQSTILALLTEKQRKKLVSLLGKVFRHPLTIQERHIPIGSEPNPDSLVESSVFFSNKAVCKELTIDTYQLTLIQRALKIADKNEMGAQLTEIMLPSQSLRFSQIAYQFEILRRGLARSLANGHTGKAIGITQSQRKLLLEQSPTVDVGSNERAEMFDKTTRRRFLSKLTKSQQEEVNNLIGEYFLVRE